MALITHGANTIKGPAQKNDALGMPRYACFRNNNNDVDVVCMCINLQVCVSSVVCVCVCSRAVLTHPRSRSTSDGTSGRSSTCGRPAGRSADR